MTGPHHQDGLAAADKFTPGELDDRSNVPRVLGRFAVSRAQGRLELDARSIDNASLWHAASLGSLALLLLVPGVIAISNPELRETVQVAFPVFTAFAAVSGFVYSFRYRLYDFAPWSRVRRHLLIEPGLQAGGTLVVDGCRRAAGDLPQVSVTRSIWAQAGAGGTLEAHTQHRVNLVSRASVVRVETFKKSEDAFALAQQIRESLGVECGPLRIDTEMPFEAAPAGVLIGVLAVSAQILPSFALVAWAATAHVADSLATQLVVAACVAAANVVALQALSLRFARLALAEQTQRTFDVATGTSPSRRAAWGWTACWAICATLLFAFRG